MNITIFFRPQPANSQPIYQQLVTDAAMAIADHRLKPGDELPSVRQVARDLDLNPMTVSRAYAELARQGWVRGRRGRRMVVREQIPSVDPALAGTLVEPHLRLALVQARRVGWSPQHLIDRLQQLIQTTPPAQ